MISLVDVCSLAMDRGWQPSLSCKIHKGSALKGILGFTAYTFCMY